MKPEPTWVQSVSERYSADARVYRELWAPLLLPHGQELLDALPLATRIPRGRQCSCLCCKSGRWGWVCAVRAWVCW